MTICLNLEVEARGEAVRVVTSGRPIPGFAKKAVEDPDALIVEAVRRGDTDRFTELVERHSPRLFAMARRHSRREEEVADIVQDIFLKAFQKLDHFRGDAPFEHWLARLGIRTCYDHLREHQRNREDFFTDLSPEESDWLERHGSDPTAPENDADAARSLLHRAMQSLSPAHRMVLTLLELEDRSVKEISALTGWSVTLVKVRAFRARAELRKVLERMDRSRYI